MGIQSRQAQVNRDLERLTAEIEWTRQACDCAQYLAEWVQNHQRWIRNPAVAETVLLEILNASDAYLCELKGNEP